MMAHRAAIADDLEAALVSAARTVRTRTGSPCSSPERELHPALFKLARLLAKQAAHAIVSENQ